MRAIGAQLSPVFGSVPAAVIARTTPIERAGCRGTCRRTCRRTCNPEADRGPGREAAVSAIAVIPMTTIATLITTAVSVAVTVTLGLCDTRANGPKAQRDSGEENQLTHR